MCSASEDLPAHWRTSLVPVLTRIADFPHSRSLKFLTLESRHKVTSSRLSSRAVEWVDVVEYLYSSAWSFFDKGRHRHRGVGAAKNPRGPLRPSLHRDCRYQAHGLDLWPGRLRTAADYPKSPGKRVTDRLDRGVVRHVCVRTVSI